MRFDVSYKSAESASSFGNVNNTQGHLMKVDRDIIITSMYMFRSNVSQTVNVAPRIYNSSNQLIGTAPSISTTRDMGWIKFTLDNPVSIKKDEGYKILFYYDGTCAIGSQGGYSDVNLTKLSTSDNKTTFTILNGYYVNGGDSIPTSYNKTYLMSFGFDFYYYVDINRSFAFHEGDYKYFNNSWISMGSNVTESDYVNYGMEDISSLPEDAWKQLLGNVEIAHFTDIVNKTELLFNIETEPFTLAEEWEDEIVKVIEYTDESARNQSYVHFETEDFYFNDKFNGNVDVLYFNDDPLKTKADIELTANYSPLDELNRDFDIVSWTDKEDIDEFKINMSALPFSQLIIQDEDFQVYGDLQQILINKISDQGSIKVLLSFDEGKTWEYYKFNEWRSIDITNENLIRNKAMDINSLTGLTMNDFNKKGKNKLRIAYYLEDNIRQQEYTKIDNLKIVSNAPIEDVKFTDVAFYLLNTLATIQLTFGGNKLMGQLEDADQGKVQYRVFLNNKPYYPSNGEFTPIAPSPIDISLNISEKDILFGQNNDLTVEFQDAWGQLDTWSTTFIGTYSGLMFMDETGQYYSNSFGGILKYLDFGIVIAGQTTMEQKVIVKNQLGQDVQNLILEVMKDQLPPGVEVELSYDNKPVFVPEDYLLFNKYIYPNDEMEFYVRITTSLTAPPAPSGQFEIRVKVDSV
ncbi:protein of unknown function [Paenibacillus sp. cl141a]|uniref:DUF4082 domain-containing protein n=1 Tax=Paenibacillus sp. cl141a TaxID=1761877 RepID=UPI0008B31973|nr:DUF4082 domain-containing protein [Paenibacillus sp. cl141a]SEL81349.1 protein of unknown function [Paenibacillus sp. cl141a]